MILIYKATSYNEKFDGRVDIYEDIKSFHISYNPTTVVVGLEDESSMTFGPNFHPKDMHMGFTLKSNTGHTILEDFYIW